MKYPLFFLMLSVFFSCTSNTIFEKPADLIPRDSMLLVLEDLLIASSTEYISNKDGKTNIDYMPFVYKTYGIDSARFKRSNFYYATKIDDYYKLLEDAKNNLEKKKNYYDSIKKNIDSLRTVDLKNTENLLDSIKKRVSIDSVRQEVVYAARDSILIDSLGKRQQLLREQELVQ